VATWDIAAKVKVAANVALSKLDLSIMSVPTVNALCQHIRHVGNVLGLSYTPEFRSYRLKRSPYRFQRGSSEDAKSGRFDTGMWRRLNYSTLKASTWMWSVTSILNPYL
jgi:hypothetical protein